MLRLALVGTGLALFVYLVVQLGPGAIVEMLGRIGWAAPLIAILYGAHQMLRAIALSASLAGAPGIRWRDAFGIRLAGEAIQFLTFTGPFLAEPAKAWLLTGPTRRVEHGFAATLTEYLTYLVTGAVMAIIALGWLLGAKELEGGWRTTAVVLLIVMVAFLVTSAWAIVARVHLLGGILQRISGLPGLRRWVKPDMRAVHATENALLGILHDRPKRFAAIAALEAGAHAVHAVELYAIVRALDLAAGLWTAFVIEGATKFVGLAFFFIPAQIGASEGAHTMIFDVLGLPAVAGFTVPFVRRIRSALVAGVGLAAMSVLTKRERQSRGSRHAGS